MEVRYVYPEQAKLPAAYVKQHSTPNILHLNLTSWIDLRTLIFFHKIVTSGEPNYLFNKLTPATSIRTKNYICFRIQTLCSRWQFVINGIRLWNNLPHQYKTIMSATQFYNKVKDLLNSSTHKYKILMK